MPNSMPTKIKSAFGSAGKYSSVKSASRKSSRVRHEAWQIPLLPSRDKSIQPESTCVSVSEFVHHKRCWSCFFLFFWSLWSIFVFWILSCLKLIYIFFLYLFFKFLTLKHPGREGVGLEGLQAGRSGVSMFVPLGFGEVAASRVRTRWGGSCLLRIPGWQIRTWQAFQTGKKNCPNLETQTKPPTFYSATWSWMSPALVRLKFTPCTTSS